MGGSVNEALKVPLETMYRFLQFDAEEKDQEIREQKIAEMKAKHADPEQR